MSFESNPFSEEEGLGGVNLGRGAILKSRRCLMGEGIRKCKDTLYIIKEIEN